jgi:DnaK suppressor protein
LAFPGLDSEVAASHFFERISLNEDTTAGGAFLDSCKEQAYNFAFVIVRIEGTVGTATMDKKRLEYYKKKLQTRREELLKSIARTEEEGRTADDDPTVDLADKAANSYTKEFLFGQTNTDRNMLALIDDALVRIKNGTYGICIECEEELAQKRLEAVPWARYCVSCAEKHEQGLL